jgi:hypothetical protein
MMQSSRPGVNSDVPSRDGNPPAPWGFPIAPTFGVAEGNTGGSIATGRVSHRWDSVFCGSDERAAPNHCLWLTIASAGQLHGVARLAETTIPAVVRRCVGARDEDQVQKQSNWLLCAD